MLMFAGGFSSCAEKEIIGGDVPYIPCPCEIEMRLSKYSYPRGEAYLFKDAVPKRISDQINKKMYSAPYPKVCWIVYYSEEDRASICIGNLSSMLSGGGICNFPDFAKEWMIPENGCKVDIEGLLYEGWINTGIQSVRYIEYVLTSLKRK